MSTISEINGEKLSQPLQVPDGQEQAYVDAYVALKQKQSPNTSSIKSFVNNVSNKVQNASNSVVDATQNFANGMGKNLSSTAMDLGKLLGFQPDSASAAWANSPSSGIAEKAGGVAGDLLTTLFPAEGGAALGAKLAEKAVPIVKGLVSGLGAGAGSAAIHQGENAVNGNGVDPSSALMELLSGGEMGSGGAAIGQGLKSAAPKILEAITNPSSRMLGSVNPPTTEGFAKALDIGMIPTDGAFNPLRVGFKAASDKMSDILGQAADFRGNLMDQAQSATGKKGIYVPHMIGQAKAALKDEISNPSSGINGVDAAATDKWFNAFADEVKNYPSYKDGYISYSDAMKAKTGIGKQTDFSADDANNAGRSLANRNLYTPMKNKTESVMQGTPQEAQFNKGNQNMQDLSPIAESLKARSLRPKSAGYLEGAADLGGILSAAHGNPAGAAFPFYSMARRDPAMAAVLYNTGKDLNVKSTGRDLISQAIRSGIFGGQK